MGLLQVVLDDYVYSFPVVNAEISGGSSVISGNFTLDEAQDLANILKAGKLPAPAKIIQSEINKTRDEVRKKTANLLDLVLRNYR